MDAVLITLVMISVAAAAGFGVVAWRALDEQRRRSAARVAALTEAIEGPAADFARAEVGAPFAVAPKPRDADVGAGFSRLGERGGPVAVSSMFTTTPGAAVRGRPVIKAAVIASMAIVLVAIMAMTTRDRAEPATVGHDGSPLELVSMRHTRDGATLAVTGLVRNPQSSATVERIAAVVFAFDRDGSFVTSGQAPLDFPLLDPGDESPFVVTLPNVGDVGRYRVSFRTDAGVVRHVDRRAQQVRRPEGLRRPVDGNRQVSVN